MDVFHVVYKVICAPPFILIVLHLNILTICSYAYFLQRQTDWVITPAIERTTGKVESGHGPIDVELKLIWLMAVSQQTSRQAAAREPRCQNISFSLREAVTSKTGTD